MDFDLGNVAEPPPPGCRMGVEIQVGRRCFPGHQALQAAQDLLKAGKAKDKRKKDEPKDAETKDSDGPKVVKLDTFRRT